MEAVRIKSVFFCGCCCFGFFLYGYGTEEGEEGGEVEDIKELSYGTGDISGNRERVMTVWIKYLKKHKRLSLHCDCDIFFERFSFFRTERWIGRYNCVDGGRVVGEIRVVFCPNVIEVNTSIDTQRDTIHTNNYTQIVFTHPAERRSRVLTWSKD